MSSTFEALPYIALYEADKLKPQFDQFDCMYNLCGNMTVDAINQGLTLDDLERVWAEVATVVGISLEISRKAIPTVLRFLRETQNVTIKENK